LEGVKFYESFGDYLTGLRPYKSISFTYDLLASDFFLPFLVPLYLSCMIGMDICVWTIGLILWLFGLGRWPGQALGIVLSYVPSLDLLLLILFALLGAVAMVGIPYVVFSAIKRKIVSS